MNASDFLPVDFNVASWFVDRPVAEGRGAAPAFHCEDRVLSYGDVKELVDRTGHALRDLGVDMLERETWLSALKLGETALAVVTQDRQRAQHAAKAFEEHDQVVQAKLYAVHKSQPGAHVTVSNELRDQFKRTLAEDQEQVRSRLAP